MDATSSGRRTLHRPSAPAGAGSIRAHRFAWSVVALCVAAASPAVLGDVEPADGEFIEFLEYLGSWEGVDGEWEQFTAETMEPAAEKPQPEASPPTLEVNASAR
jgi:hypothetical protein